MKFFQDNPLTQNDIYIVTGITLLLAILFLTPILFDNTISKIKRRTYLTSFFDLRLYKSVIRWITLFIFFLFSFRKKYRTYYLHCTNVPYSNKGFEKDLLVQLGSEPFYRYAILIGDTVHFHQKLREEKNHQRNLTFFNKLDIMTTSYKMSPESNHLLALEQARYNMISWLPKASLYNQIYNHENRKEHFLKLKEEQEALLLSLQVNENYKDIKVDTRSIKGITRKRF